MFVFFEKILLQIPNLHEKLRIKFSKSVTNFFHPPPPPKGLRPKGVSRPYPLLARFVLGGGREGDYQLNPTTRYARTPPPRVKKGVSRPYPLLARFPQELRTNINVKVFDCERSERAICERSEA